MRSCRTRRAAGRTIRGRAGVLVLTLAALLGAAAPAGAQDPNVDEVLSAVVKVSAEIPPEARTAETLGTEREGSGVVIDADGLVLTIGYLVLESMGVKIGTADGRTVPAEMVAYDHETGFGLIRSTQPLEIRPLPLGDSGPLDERDPVLVASFGGSRAALGAYVVSRRDFAGSWEYLLERAIFTAPPHLAFGGAALIDRKGSLVGIGSLIVPDAAEDGSPLPGNMFVPIDALKPVLADLLRNGRRGGPSKPWVGLYAEEHEGHVIVVRVPPGAPAHAAGMKQGDVILGVGGQPVSGLADYYRKTWALGHAGVTVPLTVLREGATDDVAIHSIDRAKWLKTRMSY